MFSLRFTAHSEVGRVRKNNQDAGYASPTMLLVTDGMGGAAAGDLASAVASTEASRSDHRAGDGEEMLERIAGMMARSNSKLSDLIEEDLQLDGMGTTFCGAMFNGEQFGLAHIGDSRGYLLRDGTLKQITHDHSWVQSLIDEGKLTPAQAAVHPHRSLILKVLNGQDIFEPDYELIDAELGDRVMFCSDGLSGLVDDADIADLLGGDSIEEAASALASAANRNGGHDNITIIIGEVVDQDDALDALPGVLVGSATEVEIPRTGQLAMERGGADREPPYPTHDVKPDSAEHSADEVARYAPQLSKRRWPGLLAAILAVALVLGGATWGLYAYSGTRYFVGADAGYVAVFNGLPGGVPGLRLNKVVERTDVAVTDLPPFFQRQVDATIPLPGLESAPGTTQSFREIARRCVEVREERRRPVPTTSQVPTPASTPSVPGLPLNPSATSTHSAGATSTGPFPSAITATPTATEEADPEAC